MFFEEQTQSPFSQIGRSKTSRYVAGVGRKLQERGEIEVGRGAGHEMQEQHLEGEAKEGWTRRTPL